MEKPSDALGGKESNLFHDSKETILSAEELVNFYGASVDRKSISHTPNLHSICNDVDTGQKRLNPTGSWVESKQVDARIRNLINGVSRPKVAQKGQLSEAVWDFDMRKALVSKSCGKYWTWMGHMHEDCLYLRSEEALFLLESNSLELTYKNVAMSVQQAFQLLISNKNSDCTLESYLTYSRLVRLGYKVLRHQKTLQCKDVISNAKRTKPVKTNKQATFKSVKINLQSQVELVKQHNEKIFAGKDSKECVTVRDHHHRKDPELLKAR